MPFWMIINFITSLLGPMVGTILASVIVFILTEGYNFLNYIIVLSIIIILSLLIEVCRLYASTRYMWESTFIRCNQFWIELSRKSIYCDYQRIEPKSGQREASKAFEALDSNWIGIEGMMKEVSTILINLIGMIVYLCLIAIYCPLVLIPMVIMIVIDFMLTTRANKIIEKN